MKFPVLVMNPTTPPKRKNTSMAKSKSNPGLQLMAAGLGMLGGAAIGAAEYGLDGQNLSTTARAAIEGLGGLALGAAATILSPGFGAGIAGAGAGAAVHRLLSGYVSAPAEAATTDTDVSGVRRRSRRRKRARLGAVEADLGAVEADLGAVEADLGAVQADLTGVDARLNGFA